MPSLEFFRNLGIFVCENFFEAELCAAICEEISGTGFKRGTIVADSGEAIVDNAVRQVMNGKVREDLETLVNERFNAIRTNLEQHFEVRLKPSTSSEFLMYSKGGFYTPHVDANNDSSPKIRNRSVSAVVFLNRESEQPSNACYGGGKLAFYGLFDEPAWRNCAFSLDPQPGLLVAFRSTLRHEVKEVTFGQRFTIVTWFLSQTDLSTRSS